MLPLISGMKCCPPVSMCPRQLSTVTPTPHSLSPSPTLSLSVCPSPLLGIFPTCLHGLRVFCLALNYFKKGFKLFYMAKTSGATCPTCSGPGEKGFQGPQIMASYLCLMLFSGISLLSFLARNFGNKPQRIMCLILFFFIPLCFT